MPNRGLNTSQAKPRIKTAIVPPKTKEKIPAATVAAKPRSVPTRGINFKSVIIGMNNMNQPRMCPQIPQGRTIFSSDLTFRSSSAKNCSKVKYPSLQPSTTSSKAKFMILLTQMQMQHRNMLLIQGLSESAEVSVPQGTRSFLGFHLRKVIKLSRLAICWAITVASVHSACSKDTRQVPT